MSKHETVSVTAKKPHFNKAEGKPVESGESYDLPKDQVSRYERRGLIEESKGGKRATPRSNKSAIPTENKGG